MRREIFAMVAALAVAGTCAAGPPSTPGYLVVPIRGVLGRDCQATTIRQVLARAVADDAVGTIVIEIDATDGADQTGIDIARALVDAGSQRRIVAWVERCAGPALPVLLACPAAYARAVDPSKPLIACTIESDAKGSASRERMRAALAAAAGTDPLRRAHAACFIDQQSHLYAWRDALGEFRASTVPPARRYPGMIDLGAGGGISLTEGQAMATGLVRAAQSVPMLGDPLAQPNWWPVTRLEPPTPTLADASAVSNASAESELDLERAARLVARLGAMLTFAEACTQTALAQPRPRLEFVRGKWTLTAESIADRSLAWDEALAAWQAILAALAEVDRLDSLARASGGTEVGVGGLSAGAQRGKDLALAVLAASTQIRADLRSTAQVRIQEIESGRVR